MQKAQILDIAFRPPDRRIGQSKDAESRFFCVSQIMLQHLFMHSRIPDNALLPYFFFSGLELGLYQTGYLTAVLQDACHRRQDQLQRDEADIDRSKVQFVRNLLMGQVAGVGAFQTHDPRILPKLPRQLAIANVHSVDLIRAVLQHTIGKSAGGGPDITADATFQVNRKLRHGLFQLQAAPAHISERIPPDFDPRIIGNRCTGLVHPLAVDKDQSAHNRSLRLLTALLKSLLRQEHIQPRFIAHKPSPS